MEKILRVHKGYDTRRIHKSKSCRGVVLVMQEYMNRRTAILPTLDRQVFAGPLT
jgi:hypothetical protein